jgi:CTP:molybdopterin cytidylyltransferase MocA
VLAAGGASRFSGPKQIASVAGQPLVSLAAQAALRHCDAGVLVMTGAYAGEVRSAVSHLDVRIVHHPDWAAGLGTTVKAAIAAAPACTGLLIVACDQPGVDCEALAALARAWRKAPRRPAAAAYAGILGIPAILPMPGARALSFSADRGAQASLMRWPGGSTAVPMATAAFDVDRPTDLAKLAPDGRGPRRES